MIEPSAAAAAETTPRTVPVAIRAWLSAEPGRSQVELAADIRLTRQFLCDVLHDRRELPDDRIALLPDGLRETVGEIRERRYLLLAAFVREAVRWGAARRGADLGPRERSTTKLDECAEAAADEAKRCTA